MIKNYFKIAFRNIWKNKAYSAINIFGLAIGLATCLLISLYVTDELSYDKFFPKANRIYRINSDLSFGGAHMHITQTPDIMGELLKKDYPEVEEYTRIYTSEGSKLIKKGIEFIDEPRVANVDSTFFNVFALPVLKGNTHTALSQPNTVVLTASAAKKYFGTLDVLNKNIEVKEGETVKPYRVSAVIEDIPDHSHFNFDLLFSMKNVNYDWGQLTSHNFHTYLLLRPGTNATAFSKHFDEYVDKYIFPYVKQFIKVESLDEMKQSGNKLEYSLMPLTKIHLYSDYTFEITPPGNIRYVYIFSAVALFILILACINFMNLSTARSAKRAREVGIRKVLGTGRKTLVAQFLTESTITALIAMAIAIGLAYLVLPLFNDIAAKSLSVKDLFGTKALLLLILLPVVVGLLAGSYPAFILSGFKPIIVLKSNTQGGFKKSILRSALVVFQFGTSIMLIISTIVMYSQLRFIQTKNLGFNKDQVLIVDGAYALNKNLKVFKHDVLAMRGVSSGTISGFLPVSNSSRSDHTYSKGAVMNMNNSFGMQTWRVDYDYIKTMGMEIAEGRNFLPEHGSDSSAILITETTAKLLGYNEPIGKMIYVQTSDEQGGMMIPLEVIGVIKDFHFESMKQKMGPLCMRLGRSAGLASFRIAAGSAKNLIPQIESTWKTMAPGMPFSYRFMNDSFNDMYRSEQRAGTIAIVFAALAILIACLGLFGLVTYMAEQRNKEIGIRKVLGASVTNVVTMLSKDFLVLVAVASVLAFPVAWWAMHKWLQDFEYRINVSAWIFLLAAFIALSIALLTVSYQAIKAAVANPVKSLRTE